MTEHEKQLRLAQLLGWTELENALADEILATPPPEAHHPIPGVAYNSSGKYLLPDYFSDLNAAHALGEEMLKRGLMQQYLDELSSSNYGEQQYSWNTWLLLLPASVRAEAALAVLEREEANEQ
jgi:hypothetical protein